MPKTIRELAEELGVSKQAIWQKIKRDTSTNLRQFMSTKGNTVYINVDGQKAIKSMFLNKSSTKNKQKKNKGDDNEKTKVDAEQEEIAFLRNLISEIQVEKKDLHKLLDQQQQLALQDKKLLEEYKTEIKDLKALNMPSQDIQKDNSVQKEATVKNIKEASNQKNKKWWNFFIGKR